MRLINKHAIKHQHTNNSANNLSNNNNHSGNVNNNSGNGAGLSENDSPNSNNNHNMRYPNPVPAINTMSSKTTSKNNASHHYSHLQSTSTTITTSTANTTGAYSNSKCIYDGTVRKSPEGKDNDSYHVEDKRIVSRSVSGVSNNSNYNTNSAGHSLNSISSNGNRNSLTNSTAAGHQKIGNDISTEIFSTSNDNGKINVQVTVLVGEFAFSLFRFLPVSIFVFYSFVSWVPSNDKF